MEIYEAIFSKEGPVKEPQVSNHISRREIAALSEEIRKVSPESVSEFLNSTARIIKFLTLREIEEWAKAGISIGRKSGDLAVAYFSSIPSGLDSIYATERRKIFQLTSSIAQVVPEVALDFYRNCPSALLNVNPSLRDAVLNGVFQISSERPEEILRTLKDIISALKPLSWPDQKIVMDQVMAIQNISKDGAIAFIRNAGDVVIEISGQFLIHWVKRGLSMLKEDEERGIQYFSLLSKDSSEELSRWKEAILLDDNIQILSLFALALSGKKMAIKSTENLDSIHLSFSRNYPTTDGETIFLPPCMADFWKKEENFRQYKMATAHQSGYIEFGTFDWKFPIIRAIVDRLPCKEMAWDILFILEDGRIDRKLKEEYEGIRADIDMALLSAIIRRPSPMDLPIREAVIECLLRLTTGNLNSFEVSDALSDHVRFLERAMEGFYERATGVWDCFKKAMEIYIYLISLESPIPFPKEEREIEKTERHSFIPYIPSLPVEFRGKIAPEIIQTPFKWQIMSHERKGMEQGTPMPVDELKKLIETIKDPTIWKLVEGDDLQSQGLFITGLEELMTEAYSTSCEKEEDGKRNFLPSVTVLRSIKKESSFYYDEWDYLHSQYRRNWCCVRERIVDPHGSGFVEDVYRHYRDLIKNVKMQFQRIRPSSFQLMRRVEWGDEIDLPAAVERAVDIKSGQSPSDRIFSRREKRLRRVSTLLLIDMSASTDEVVQGEEGSNIPSPEDWLRQDPPMEGRRKKKVIDIEKESLVVMVEAFESLEDEYGIFGFSGHGRENVDFYLIKDFSDPYSEEMKMRIGAIQPKQSTRMGAAIRHAVSKFRSIESDQRLLILLSDGFPQDHDYGEDRRSKDYALHDTMMALIEAKREGIRPFCITVDRSGNDYLRKMCDPESYLVIYDIYTLPERLPRIVESLIV